MSKYFETNKLMMIAIALDDEEKEREEELSLRKNKKRRFWVHPSLIDGKSEGEFYTLLPHLIDDEIKFYEYFKMSHATFEMILSKIHNRLSKSQSMFRESICPRQKLVVCLRFLTTGDSYKTIAFNYRLGHSTVRTIVLEVCDAINNILLTETIPTPCKEDWFRISKEMWSMWNFPNCLGAIDGKHVVIDAPANSGSLYFNYKRSFSVVLLALVDANYKFIAVDIGSYGKNSDGWIFSTSKLGKALENEKLNVPEDSPLPGTDIVAPHVIVADEAFPLKTYMMRPYPKARGGQDKEKSIFNYRLSRARRLVECAFGILAQKFRLYCRRLRAQPQNAETIILTTCILHNIIRTSTAVPYESAEQLNTENFQNVRRQRGNASSAAFAVRDTFKQFFNSPTGSVPWQDDKI